VPMSLAVRGWRAHNHPTVRTICAVAFGARFLRLNGVCARLNVQRCVL
jgi:hypothetical protein